VTSQRAKDGVASPRRALQASDRVGAGTTPGLPGGGHFDCELRGVTGQLERCLRRDLQPSSACVPLEHLSATQLVCLHQCLPMLAYFWAFGWDQRLESFVAKSCSWYTFGSE
jgi:hypothetical protein